jgi:hypothetical protein
VEYLGSDVLYAVRAMPRDATIQELLEEVLSVRSMPRLYSYNEEQLRLRESLETALKKSRS